MIVENNGEKLRYWAAMRIQAIHSLNRAFDTLKVNLHMPKL